MQLSYPRIPRLGWRLWLTALLPLFVLAGEGPAKAQPLTKAQILAKEKEVDKDQVTIAKPDFDPATVPVEPVARQKWLYGRLFAGKLPVGGIRQLSEYATAQAKYFRQQGFDAAMKGNDRMGKYGESMGVWFDKQCALLDKIVAANEDLVKIGRDDTLSTDQKQKARGENEVRVRDILINLRTVVQNPPTRPN